MRNVLGIILATSFLASVAAGQQLQRKDFGTTLEGWPVEQYILTNNNGASARIINYGAIVTNLFVPDKNGKMGDVVLGFDNVKQYEEIGPFMGCIAGRYANRIANGTFTIDGINYAVTLNQGTNCLHGGFKGLAKRMWQGDMGITPDGPTVRLTILDPGGTEGFPGNLKVTVYYTLTNNNWLKVQYYATTDAPTPINLTHHSYFNLSGNASGDVLGYVAKLYATHYLPVDAELIPTGEIASVAGTPFNFTKAKLIGRDIKSLPPPFTGYDHTMVLDNPKANLMKAAEVYDPESGRMVECWTTEPAFQFFTGNNLAGITGKGGVQYQPHMAFCLETQHYPDSPNHPSFPNTILRPGEVYRQVTEFRFSVPANPLQAEQ
ncbi:MAG TPA: aldose epimerase family protein [Tepidisphaeraceae bacterium]|nr:aldose epimerase family protein [Tepidisphaeraceae bacterium]